MPDRLSLYQLHHGLTQLRRILTTTAGQWHAGEICPYAPEHVKAAERALNEVEQQAMWWRLAHEVRRAGLRHRLDIEAIEREVAFSTDDRILR